jgi:hypothetical protein
MAALVGAAECAHAYETNKPLPLTHLLKSLGSTTPSRHTGSSRLAVHSSLTGSEPAQASAALKAEKGAESLRFFQLSQLLQLSTAIPYKAAAAVQLLTMSFTIACARPALLPAPLGFSMSQRPLSLLLITSYAPAALFVQFGCCETPVQPVAFDECYQFHTTGATNAAAAAHLLLPTCRILRSKMLTRTQLNSLHPKMLPTVHYCWGHAPVASRILPSVLLTSCSSRPTSPARASSMSSWLRTVTASSSATNIKKV